MSDLTICEIPQWQGSSSPMALRLSEGARLLASLAPGARLVRPRLVSSPGTTADGVRHGAVVAANLAAIRQVLERSDAQIVAGGDCGVELAPIEAAHRRAGARLAVVWFDAHGDLHTPASSPSGAFHGMVLRTLLGGGPKHLVPDQPLRPEQIVLAGVRALEPAEREFVNYHRIRHLRPAELRQPSALAEAVAATGADTVYLHIDLDVLDPSSFASVGVPEPGGLTPSQLIGAIGALAGHFTVAAAGITEYHPTRHEDLATLRQLIAATIDAVTGVRPENPQEIERHAVLAWPAAVTRNAGGWLLRHTPGVTRRRSNSALPPSPGSHPDQTLKHVEGFYTRRRLPTAVQITPAEHHSALDDLLDARGYQRAAPTLVLTTRAGSLVAASPPARQHGPKVRLAQVPTPAWLEAFSKLDGHADATAVARRVICSIGLPAAYASVTISDQIAGIGLLVGGHTGWGGIYCMATHPAHRRRGIASAILGELARWAAEHGTEHLYLQVEEGNEPARRLYTGVGFTGSHLYHYRIANRPAR